MSCVYCEWSVSIIGLKGKKIKTEILRKLCSDCFKEVLAIQTSYIRRKK